MSEEQKKSKHIHFPVKQFRYKGIPHVGIKGKWFGKCECGQALEYVNNNIHHGWFTTDDKYILRTLEEAQTE